MMFHTLLRLSPLSRHIFAHAGNIPWDSSQLTAKPRDPINLPNARFQDCKSLGKSASPTQRGKNPEAVESGRLERPFESRVGLSFRKTLFGYDLCEVHLSYHAQVAFSKKVSYNSNQLTSFLASWILVILWWCNCIFAAAEQLIQVSKDYVRKLRFLKCNVQCASMKLIR